MRTARDSVIVDATAFAPGSVSREPVMAARSRAMPNIDCASPRLGVSFSVKIVSPRPRTSRTSAPTGASGESTSSPACSSESPSSRAEQSIPLDSTPRSFAFLISRPGSLAPIIAHGTFWPSATLGAPQTICRSSPVPASTSVTRSLSAFGCGETFFTCATTMPEKAPPRETLSSTSRPPMVSARASASTSRSTATSSFSHATETFIGIAPGTSSRSRRRGAGRSRRT